MAARRIHLRGDYRYLELEAAESDMKPGMLLERDANGKAVKHATEGARGELLIGLEDALQGKTVDDAYTLGEKVPCAIFEAGAEAYMWLEDGADVVIDQELISSGNGMLKARDDASGVTVYQSICRALEALDLTLSGTTHTLMKVVFVTA